MNPGFNFNTILYRGFILLVCIMMLLFFYKSKANNSATGNTMIIFSKTNIGKNNHTTSIVELPGIKKRNTSTRELKKIFN